MKTDKSSMQSHGIFDSKPDTQGTPGIDGNDHGKVTVRPGKLKSGRPKGGINQGGINKPK